MAEINKSCGRDGYWYTTKGSTSAGGTTAGTIFPPTASGMFAFVMLPTARGMSTRAAHTYGSGFSSATDFGGMGFALNSVAGTNMAYNAMAAGYSGVTFWAMLGSDTGVTSPLTNVTFKVTDGSSDPSGAKCSGTGAMQCYDDPSAPVTLAASWVQIKLPFSMIKTQGWGNGGPLPRAVDATALYQMQWQFQPKADAGTFAFDLWIDDVSFM
jgi:hypothetical protein